MKSHIVALSVALSVALASAGAFAQSKSNVDAPYIELGYASAQYNSDGIPGLSNANQLRITLGKNMSENFAIDGVYATDTNDSSTTALASTVGTVNFKLTSSYGVHIKPKMMISDAVELFARLGYFSQKSTDSRPAVNTNVDSNGTSLSYGLGASLKFSQNVYGSLDWMQMYKKDGLDIKGMGLSIGYKF